MLAERKSGSKCTATSWTAARSDHVAGTSFVPSRLERVVREERSRISSWKSGHRAAGRGRGPGASAPGRDARSSRPSAARRSPAQHASRLRKRDRPILARDAPEAGGAGDVVKDQLWPERGGLFQNRAGPQDEAGCLLGPARRGSLGRDIELIPGEVDCVEGGVLADQVSLAARPAPTGRRLRRADRKG